MRFGIFMAPFHTRLGNPTVAIERDLELVRHVDRLGFAEAWVGEHHSGGVELIPDPMLAIAVMAERTRHIRLGTGVVSLGYHHPMTVAEKMVWLDHVTRGRVMLGVGPGALAIDAFQRGFDPRELRERMAQSFEAIVALLAGETVDMETDWFTLQDTRLQLLPFTRPCFELAVAALVSPSGPTLAGRFGASMLQIGATFIEDGTTAMRTHWQAYEETSAANGHSADRSTWRIVMPWHVAATRAQAFADVEHGLKQWVRYASEVASLPLGVEGLEKTSDIAEALVAKGFCVVGTPADAIARIEELQEQSQGFGALLSMPNDWADHEATLRSYSLFAEEVMPHFQGSAQPARDSYEWGKSRKAAVTPGFHQAMVDSTKKFYGTEHERTKAVVDRFGDHDAAQPAGGA